MRTQIDHVHPHSAQQVDVIGHLSETNRAPTRNVERTNERPVSTRPSYCTCRDIRKTPERVMPHASTFPGKLETFKKGPLRVTKTDIFSIVNSLKKAHTHTFTCNTSTHRQREEGSRSTYTRTHFHELGDQRPAKAPLGGERNLEAIVQDRPARLQDFCQKRISIVNRMWKQ